MDAKADEDEEPATAKIPDEADKPSKDSSETTGGAKVDDEPISKEKAPSDAEANDGNSTANANEDAKDGDAKPANESHPPKTNSSSGATDGSNTADGRAL